MESKGCKHYQCKCEQLSPCCSIQYPCRLCHDELQKGPKAPGCQDERMDRYKVAKIRCTLCNTEQEPSQTCKNEQCNIKFARQYCNVCRLYEDDPRKAIFHCEKCNMCRRGIKEEHFHCDPCGICLNISLKNNHICREGTVNSDCPICIENMLYSRIGTMQLERCGHWIHNVCLNKQLQKTHKNACPICNVAIQKQSKEEIQYIDEQLKEVEQFMPAELKGKRVEIWCAECLKKQTNINSNILGIKCPECGCQNTTITKNLEDAPKPTENTNSENHENSDGFVDDGESDTNNNHKEDTANNNGNSNNVDSNQPKQNT